MGRRRYRTTRRPAKQVFWRSPPILFLPPFTRHYVSDEQYQADAQSLLRSSWRVSAVHRDHLGIHATYAQIQPASPVTGGQQSLYVDHATQRRSWSMALKIGGALLVLVVAIAICSAVLSPSSSGAITGGTNTISAADATSQAFAYSLAATATMAAIEATPTSLPTATATPKPTSTPKPPTPVVTGVGGNPWGYNFSPGNYIYNPPGAFCGYFNCISTFWNGSGYVEECQDGMYSLSGGIQGSCSRHGGDWRPLYSH